MSKPKLTPHQQLGAAVLDVLVSVSPGVFERVRKARDAGTGTNSVLVDPGELLKLRELLEAQFPGAEAQTRTGMRCDACGRESYHHGHRQDCPTLRA